MPRSLLVGALVLGVFLSGCATRSRVVNTTDPPLIAAGWEPPPRAPEHPVLNWCQQHPVTTIAGTAAVVGAVMLATEAALIAAVFVPLAA
jgi:hypothetical protein